MNPFTHFLSLRSPDRRLRAFIGAWDELEALVIRVYKANRVAAEDDVSYRQVRAGLVERKGHWAEWARPHGQASGGGGAPPAQDPFLRLISAESAAAFVGDWEAMQYLPAAREALNRLVLQQT